ncbi:hypothetical protein [Methanobacterium sp. SMA-27]|uniref:hypothetical protein n=1 Tax=Methanobacterium sp. SMA-27 TaxID=1495336 RepID=UPI0012E0691A|nr:hypothetical protein [Methanobacterium sp. SMA-27]
MSKYANECLIYCDAYGSYVIPSECEKCLLKKDCIKIKLSIIKSESLNILNTFKL